jgi:hypothetical protein
MYAREGSQNPGFDRIQKMEDQKEGEKLLKEVLGALGLSGSQSDRNSGSNDPFAQKLNNIVSTKQVNEKLNEIWNKSKHGTKDPHEWGAQIVSRDGKYSAEKEREGTADFVVPSYPSKYNKKDGDFEAIVHTHPYENPNNTGAPHSAGDIFGLKDFFAPERTAYTKGGINEGAASIIEAGTVRFAIVITNIGKAQEFLSKFGTEQDLNRALNKIIGPSPGSNQIEKRVNAIATFLGENSGLSFYRTTDAGKQNFEKVTPQQ